MAGRWLRVAMHFLLTSSCLLVFATANGHFLASNNAARRTISIKDVEARVSASLNLVLSGKAAGARQEQLSNIQAAMWKTFHAMPKNAMGRLSPGATRHMIRSYFVARHGWIINGLEADSMNFNASEVHDSVILLDKVPRLVEDLLAANRRDHGLLLTEVVAMAAVLEQLILDETFELLHVAYTFNDCTTSDRVDSYTLLKIMASYLVLFEAGANANLTDGTKHRNIMKKLENHGGGWHDIRVFIHDTVGNAHYSQKDRRNPFTPTFYSFDDAWQLAAVLLSGYGAVQDGECRGMTDALAQLDPKGNGRVLLHTFYSQPPTADYQFKEAAHYLQKIGALDKASGTPQVRIANYVQGPSNCLVHAAYFSVCCLAPCHGIMRELEESVRAPSAPPEQLLSIVGNISSPSVDAPRQLSIGLWDKLHAVAVQHGGEVPLHGRLFAQWLHFAFPQECPFPHLVENASVITARHWQNGKSSFRVTPAEKNRLIQEGAAIEEAFTGDPLVLEWSNEEVLPLQPPQQCGRTTISIAASAVVLVSTILVVIRIGLASLQAANGPSSEKLNNAVAV